MKKAIKGGCESEKESPEMNEPTLFTFFAVREWEEKSLAFTFMSNRGRVHVKLSANRKHHEKQASQ